MKKQLKLLVALFVLTVLIPFPYTVVPEWKVKVLYENGLPASGKQVNQMWTDSSVAMGLWMPMESLTIDNEGFVIFPERTFYAPLLLRGIGYLLSFIDFWSHASYGKVSHFSVAGGYEPSVTFRPGDQLENTWVIRPSPGINDENLLENGTGLPSSK